MPNTRRHVTTRLTVNAGNETENVPPPLSPEEQAERVKIQVHILAKQWQAGNEDAKELLKELLEKAMWAQELLEDELVAELFAEENQLLEEKLESILFEFYNFKDALSLQTRQKFKRDKKKILDDFNSFLERVELDIADLEILLRTPEEYLTKEGKEKIKTTENLFNSLPCRNLKTYKSFCNENFDVTFLQLISYLTRTTVLNAFEKNFIDYSIFQEFIKEALINEKTIFANTREILLDPNFNLTYDQYGTLSVQYKNVQCEFTRDDCQYTLREAYDLGSDSDASSELSDDDYQSHIDFESIEGDAFKRSLSPDSSGDEENIGNHTKKIKPTEGESMQM